MHGRLLKWKHFKSYFNSFHLNNATTSGERESVEEHCSTAALQTNAASCVCSELSSFLPCEQVTAAAPRSTPTWRWSWWWWTATTSRPSGTSRTTDPSMSRRTPPWAPS